jgi:tetratricopeptide (TPR) repeat protein
VPARNRPGPGSDKADGASSGARAGTIEAGGEASGASLRQLAQATALHQAGRLEDAEAAYAALLRDHPDDPTALVNGGALAIARGDAAGALERLERAVRLTPHNAIAFGNLGFARIHAGDDAGALAALDEAVRLEPRHAQAWNNRGIALTRLGRTEEAAAAFERALAVDPRAIDAAVNLGDVRARAGDASAARAAFERALAIDPESVRARTGRALAVALSGDLDAARTALEALVARHPGAGAAWKTLGAVANWSWDHERAAHAFGTALAADPGDDEAAFGVASTLLARGRYAEGFAAFERRREGIGAPATRFAALPAWDGGTLAGTLLLYPEQGLGDVVQFARFTGAARRRAGRIVLLLDGYWQSLAPLLATLEGVDRVVTTLAELDGEQPSARASILSLPFLLGATPQTLDPSPYLTPPADRRATWASRLAAATAPRTDAGLPAGVASPRVGLAWSVFARSDYGYVTRHKSIPAAALRPLLSTPGVSFVTLQPGAAGDPAAFGAGSARIADPRAAIRDFGDTAALIAELDLVIAPDTAVAHVAGAIGVPVFMLDRYNSCWRWRLLPDATPWYPSMRIFRQARFGDWSQPVADATAALRAWLADRAG